MPTIYNFIKYTIESFSYRNQRRKINKSKPNWRGSTTVTACRWHYTIYKKSERQHQKKLLELIKEFSEVEGYKMKIQNSAAFLYTKKELLEKQIKKTIPFQLH